MVSHREGAVKHCLRALTGAILAAHMLASNGTAQCSAGSPAADHVDRIRLSLDLGDSTYLVRSGVPYKPASVSLVSDPKTCRSAVSAFNALYPTGSPYRVSSLYVIKADGVYVVTRENPTPGYRPLYVFFSSKWKRLIEVG
jgi:ribosomal protein S27AE